MALTQEAFDHYKNLVDSAKSDKEREEILAGIEQHHSQENYFVTDPGELRGFGQQALNRVPSDQINNQIPVRQENKDAIIDASGGDILTGVKRGVQNLQAMNYGAMALAGKGLKRVGLEDIGQKTQNIGMEGYRRNVEEAEQYPARHSFKDVYTGEAGVGGTIDWAQGTLGELIPSMAEAAVGSVIGAAAGSAVGPGGTIGGGAVGGLAGRTILKKSIEKGVQQAVKAGVGKATESEIRKQVTKRALQKLGGKVGIAGAVMPMESGGMYASLLEEHGVDAPETALLFGALATSLEFAGGNSKLVDVFVDALSKNKTGMVKRTAKELLKNIPQEAGQEGGQEIAGILNTVINTDEKFLTTENLESVIESMAAGAIGGGAGALVSSTMNARNDTSDSFEGQVNTKFENIKSQGADKIPASIVALDQEIIKNNQLLQNTETLEALAEESDNDINDLTSYITLQNEFNQELKTRLQAEVDGTSQAEVTDSTETANTDIETTIKQYQEKDNESKNEINNIDEQLLRKTKQYQRETDVNKKKVIEEDIATLRKEKKILLDVQAHTQAALKYNQEKNQTKTVAEQQRVADEQKFMAEYNQLQPAPNSFLREAETSAFKSEPQFGEVTQVDLLNQSPAVAELENQLEINNQQLDALAEQINNTPDFNEQLALQQEGAVLYEQNAALQTQLNNQLQSQEQIQREQIQREQFLVPETAENTNIEPQFKVRENQEVINKVNLADIEKAFPGQEVNQAADGIISVQFKNGKGLTIKSIQDAGQGFIKMAVETGQMSKPTDQILGLTVGNEILLDENFADNKTLWHENKHVFDNLGMITKADNNALNKEFNKLRKAGKLEFALSKHADPKQRMIENRANMFAQIMVNRAAYRDTPFDKVIQRVMDFFQQLLAMGKQSVTGLAREVESGKIYERQVGEQTYQTTVPQAETAAQTWYSALERAVDGFQQKQAPANQWKGMIKNYPGVKPAELEWIGLDDWFAKQKGKVSKNDLLKFIQENNVQLEEVVKDNHQNQTMNNDGSFVDLSQTPMSFTQHSDYQLPRGKNYKELILTLPNKQTSLNEDAQAMFGKDFTDLTTSELSYLNNKNNRKSERYTHDHWPDITNPLAHVRFNERIDADGNKVLFLEEVQSDWHQEGRKEGYGPLRLIVIGQDSTGFPIRKPFEISQRKEAEQYAKEINGRIEENYEDPLNKNVPDAPFKKAWPLLTMKRMVRYAAENGFDKIAWTTGQQQADRYGLSERVARIDYEKKENDYYIVEAIPQDGNTDRQYFRGSIEEISNALGKEITKKIVAGNNRGSITDIDLQIGGEGMKKFYDKMLPSMINKEFNRGKWGKAKVEQIQIVEDESIKVSKEDALIALKEDRLVWLDGNILASFPSEIESYQGNNITTSATIQQVQLSLPITKRMRDKALREGMPMFQIGKRIVNTPKVYLDKVKEITNTDAFKNWFGVSKITSNGQPHILYHGTNNSQFLQDKNTDWVFDTTREPSQTSSPLAGLGIFLGNDTIASAHAGTEGTIHPFFVKVENPYITTAEELEQNIKSSEDAQAMKKRLQELSGYDGIILKDRGQVIAFNPEQLKSVTDNTGAFDADNSDVRFEVREMPKQKLTDAQYNASFKKKNNLLQSLKQLGKIRGHEIKLLADKLTGSISTRLANANPMLRDKMRRLDFDTSQKIITALHTAKPLLEKTKDMSAADKHAWDLARKQADQSKIRQIAERYGMLEDQEKLRKALDDIREQAKDVGYEVGYIEEYWPRIIKDQEGFLQATQGLSERPDFTEAIKAKAKKMGLTVEELNNDFPEVRADIISGMILSRGYGIGGPGNIQSRKYETIPEELEKYYMNSDAALMQYIYSMTKKIEARKFFGKVPPKIQGHKNAITRAQSELNRITTQAEQYQNNGEISQIMNERINELNDRITLHNEALNLYKEQRDYTENIGAYIAELMLTGELNKKDEKAVREILEARFNEHGTTGAVNAFKNMAYIDVMGNPIAALTQIGDLAWAMYVGKVWTPRGFSNTTKNIINATLNKSKITKEDLGIERIAQEFADGTTLGNAVNSVFKLVGLTKIDSIGKETLINNALMNYQAQVKTEAGMKALEKQIRPIFGIQTKQVIKDLAVSDINSDNISDNVKMLLYSKLLDFQPAALSEMPEYYLKGGKGRVFYMLKTYTIKQMDVFRNEVVHEVRSEDPQRIMIGIGNMVKLVSLLTLANASADELKDLVLGKETKFKDNVIENFLTLGGASRYMQTRVDREGFATAMAQKMLPPFKFINSIYADTSEKITTGDVERGLRSVDSIPFVGKWYYWHHGRGAEYKKTINEQDFSEANKRFRKFKKEFEKTPDKRLFLQTNVVEFRQMELHRNFQTALNGNKATINKLEKLKQTPAVVKRLGQLENQRTMFYNGYFEKADQLAMR